MPRSTAQRVLACVLSVLAVAGASLPAVAAPAQVSMEVASLASGRYGRLHAVLEKTFLRIRVVAVEMRLGRATAARLERLIAGRNHSAQLAEQAARVLYTCDDAYVRLTFLRDIDIDSFLLGVRSNLDQARRAGVLTSEQREQLRDTIPRAFMTLGDRGIRHGDVLQYRVRGDAVRTVLSSARGIKLLDRTDFGAAGRLGQMGGYFAPGTDLRDDVLHSLW